MGKYNCEVCKRKCKKEAIRLQDKYFHLECFTCAECKEQLSMEGFYTRNNLHYCPKDYQSLFSVRCDGCGELAEGEVMTVLGKSFHHHCFKCSFCGKHFDVGEKVTFSKDQSICQVCCKDVSKQPVRDVVTPSKSPTKLTSASPSLTQMKQPMSNGHVVDPTERAPSVADPNFMKPKTSRSLPRAFGMPDSRFYNITYMDRANNNIRRGVTVSQQQAPPPLPIPHFHRPDNFSYNNVRKDFLPERTKKHKDTKDLLPIEREDWPGPPEPAAAYPELLREKLEGRVVLVKEDESKAVKQLTKISKQSGTAAELLKEFEQRGTKEDSPNLDPRNASRTPSAAVEPRHNPRYPTPYYASPSRYLDMLPQRSKSTDNNLRKPLREDVVRPYTSLALRSTLNTFRTGSSFDNKLSDDEDTHPSRPVSTVDSYMQDRLSSLRYADAYPDTKAKASTLPHGLIGLSNFSKLATNAFNISQPAKKYAYEELLKHKQLPGVDRSVVERHLLDEDFERVFHMDQRDFQHLPVWQRNELKIKVGLIPPFKA